MNKIGVALLALLVSMPLSAREFEVDPAACAPGCQDEFREVSEDAIALIDYKALGPAEPGGLAGFGIGAFVSWLPIDEESAWNTVTGENFSGVGLVGAQVTKGLPLDLDVGAFYTAMPETDVKAYGAELRYAILEGSTATPALALRGAWSTVDGIEDFELESKSLDLSLSKGFTLLTPYVGAGYVWGKSTPDPAITASTGLREEKVEEFKAYLGVRIALGFFELTPELERVGETSLYTLRIGFGI